MLFKMGMSLSLKSKLESFIRLFFKTQSQAQTILKNNRIKDFRKICIIFLAIGVLKKFGANLWLSHSHKLFYFYILSLYYLNRWFAIGANQILFFLYYFWRKNEKSRIAEG